MKKKSSGTPSQQNRDFEVALSKRLKELGAFIPTTIKEVEIMEGILSSRSNNNDISIPSVDDILSRKNTNSEDIDTSPQTQQRPYSLAARNGQDEISADAKEKMKQLKKKDQGRS